MICSQNIRVALDNIISSTVSVLVPAVCRADFDVCARQRALDVVDLAEELRSCEVSPVQCFGSDGDGVDLGRKFRGVGSDSGLVQGIRGVGIRPDQRARLATCPLPSHCRDQMKEFKRTRYPR
jgi:hypothetical protein